jgi:hypothetical protein
MAVLDKPQLKTVRVPVIQKEPKLSLMPAAEAKVIEQRLERQFNIYIPRRSTNEVASFVMT